MNAHEPSIKLPEDVRRKIHDEQESLLWGWDHRLCHWMRSSDALPMACVIERRLRARASAERAMTRQQRAELYELAARGWRRIIERLVEKKAKAA